MINRVVQISPYYPPFVDGQSHLTQSLALALVSRGWKSEVLTSDSGGSRGTSIEDGVIVRRLRSFDLGNTAIMPMLLPRLLGMAPSRTVLHLHVGRAFAPEVAYLASRLRRVSFVTQLHGDMKPSSRLGFLLPFYKSQVLSRIFRDASVVFVLNSDFGQILEHDFHYSDKFTVVRNGIADEWFDACVPHRVERGSPLKLLYVGRLAPGKNLPGLVESLSHLPDGSVHLEIVGSGPEETLVRHQADRLGLMPHVEFRGHMSRPEIIQRMRDSHALILPSLYEGQPLSILEAMAAQLPIICTNVIGLRGLVNGCAIETGTTPNEIAAGIRRFQSLSLASVQAMVDSARERAENHRWAHLIATYESAYLSALASNL